MFLPLQQGAGEMTSSDSEFPIAATFSGPVRGKRENDLIVFRGIRYGAAPSGRDRFRPSRRPVPWREPFDAFEFGASAIQMPLGIAEFSGSSPISEALSPILPRQMTRRTQAKIACS